MICYYIKSLHLFICNQIIRNGKVHRDLPGSENEIGFKSIQLPSFVTEVFLSKGDNLFLIITSTP